MPMTHEIEIRVRCQQTNASRTAASCFAPASGAPI
jgi:hypothetical protein